MRPSIPRSIASASRSILSHPPPRLHRLPSHRHLSSSSASTSTDLISELESRNLISHITSRSLLPHLSAAPRTVYSGVDPSADSLHVGNLLPLLTLVHFARFHHNPIVLVGGATGSIGDPSGRSSERNALDATTLQRNVSAIGQQIQDFFSHAKDFLAESGSSTFDAGVTMMNNHEWMSRFTLLDFLSTVGRHSRMTSMLSRESVASRLSPGAAGMSYTEFSYQLLQAYDFSFLHTHHSCTVQIGGSDQLGNITAGIDLIRRTASTSLETDPAYGMTLPLLTTASGEKFGKSAGNAVWLSRQKTSDWKFYQFFLRSGDAEVERYLKCLTLLPVDEVETIMKSHEEERKQRKAQTALADHMTRLIRGTDAVRRCKLIIDVLFSHTKNANPKDTLAQLNLEDIDEDDVVARLNRDDVVGVDVTRVVVKAGLVKSRAEAKRLAASGGLYVNNRQVAGEGSVVREEELVRGRDGRGGLCLVRAGKAGVKVVYVGQT